jgi:hypothetical protein
MSHYVKFTYQCARADIGPFNTLAELNACRRKLLELRLIGLDSNGIGFGNLSVRDRRKQEFLHHGFSDGWWSPQAVAYGLRASRRLRFQEKLAAIRRRCDSSI